VNKFIKYKTKVGTLKNNLLLILIVAGIFSGVGQNAVVEGKIIPKNPSDFDKARELKLAIKTSDTIWLTEVQPDLTFKFDRLRSDSIHLHIAINNSEKSDYKLFIAASDTIQLEIPYSYYCKYDKSKNDKTCPICKKQNRAIPTSHGFFQSRKFYSLGCIGSECEPNWYCKRDKILF